MTCAHLSLAKGHPTINDGCAKRHWPEYLIEAACLGLFMISAFGFATLLEHPASPVHQALPNSLLRRFLMGLAMGGTAICIIYSPWGKQSGAHINPSTTLTFYGSSGFSVKQVSEIAPPRRGER